VPAPEERTRTPRAKILGHGYEIAAWALRDDEGVSSFGDALSKGPSLVRPRMPVAPLHPLWSRRHRRLLGRGACLKRSRALPGCLEKLENCRFELLEACEENVLP